MRFLEKLDTTILDSFFQKIADLVNDQIGKSCFWLARMSCWIVIITWTFEIVFYKLGQIESRALFLLWILSVMSMLNNLEEEDKKNLNLFANRVMNPQRLWWPFGLCRAIAVILIAPVFVGHIISFVESKNQESLVVLAKVLSFLASIYFAACTPKPRSPLKSGNRLAAEVAPARS